MGVKLIIQLWTLPHPDGYIRNVNNYDDIHSHVILGMYREYVYICIHNNYDCMLLLMLVHKSVLSSS